jgi:hypothetical protein
MQKEKSDAIDYLHATLPAPSAAQLLSSCMAEAGRNDGNVVAAAIQLTGEGVVPRSSRF